VTEETGEAAEAFIGMHGPRDRELRADVRQRGGGGTLVGRQESGSLDGPMDIAAAVAEFHMAFNLPMRQLPSAEIDHALARLRVALLEEEVGEFIAASEKGDLVGIADALADIVYVIYGTALTYGIDLDTVLREVHRSNMSKLGSDGKPLIRDDGKVLKSEKYFPPDIESVLSLQAR
jgi:predicted HAD superfamily Cof-like phosphohydrolase